MYNLHSISPIDGRYSSITQKMSKYFSEFGLIKTRVVVEIEYFISLCEVLPELSTISDKNIKDLRYIHLNFDENDAHKIKEIEKKTNHDVKSIEIFVRDKICDLGLEKFKEFVHFGLTSQDVNSLANSINLKKAIDELNNKELEKLIKKLEILSEEWKDVVIISRTHGQPASPTTLGKELKVYIERLLNQKKKIYFRFSTKFGGAVGNLNAHYVAYPQIDWKKFMDNFVSRFFMYRNQYTTQIDHYDNFSEVFDIIKRINNILIDLNQDVWMYISMNFLQQKIIKDEVGSSVMPHKINPINFENSEANLLLANNLLNFLSNKLPVSRLQRDLTDSSISRNIGVAFAHSLIGYTSLLRGMGKLKINLTAIDKDIDENYIVISEALQTILRKYGHKDAYNTIKNHTRINKTLDKNNIHQMIDKLDVTNNIKDELKTITPKNYIGYLKHQ